MNFQTQFCNGFGGMACLVSSEIIRTHTHTLKGAFSLKRRSPQESDDMAAALQLLDLALVSQAQKKFKIQGFEAFRLEATLCQNHTQLENARELIGDDWNLMTRKLMQKGLVVMPEKGPIVLTSKAVRFLVISSRPIFKN